MTYTVVENTPGYLPEEDDPLVTDDLGAAKEYMRELVERLCEHLDEVEEPYQVYWAEDGTAAFVQEDRQFALGRSFEVMETPIG